MLLAGLGLWLDNIFINQSFSFVFRDSLVFNSSHSLIITYKCYLSKIKVMEKQVGICKPKHNSKKDHINIYQYNKCKLKHIKLHYIVLWIFDRNVVWGPRKDVDPGMSPTCANHLLSSRHHIWVPYCPSNCLMRRLKSRPQVLL